MRGAGISLVIPLPDRGVTDEYRAITPCSREVVDQHTARSIFVTLPWRRLESDVNVALLKVGWKMGVDLFKVSSERLSSQ